MTPGQRHAVLAAAALVPVVVYEAVEVAQGDDGWPYSRFLRLLPPVVFFALLAAFLAWFPRHIHPRRRPLAPVIELERFRAC